MPEVYSLDLAKYLSATGEKLKNLFLKMHKEWSSIPGIACKGLCQRECGNVPLFPIEAMWLEQKYKIPIPVANHSGADTNTFSFRTLGINAWCPFLSEPTTNGRCTIYQDRPSICRAYGHDILQLKCPHGCKPASRPLTSVMYNRIQEVFIKMAIFDKVYKGRIELRPSESPFIILEERKWPASNQLNPTQRVSSHSSE